MSNCISKLTSPYIPESEEDKPINLMSTMTADTLSSFKLENNIDIIKGMVHSERFYGDCKNKQNRLCSRDSRDCIINSPVNVIEGLDEERTYERHEICKWMYKVIDYFSLERETMVVAMSYFDRYMVMKGKTVRQLEITTILLMAVASLYLATKLNEPKDRVSLHQFAVLSQGKFSQNQIAAMEYELLVTLEWFVNPPTPQEFAHQLLSLLPTDGQTSRYLLKILEISNYIIELSIFEVNLATEKASIIACAANFIAMKCASRSIISQKTIDDFQASLTNLGVINIDQVTLIEKSLVESLNLTRKTLQKIQTQIDPDGVMYQN